MLFIPIIPKKGYARNCVSFFIHLKTLSLFL
ncbi:hypothetical protein HMPREF9140_00421 [Prevotella micans F0438]|uniref:Uncharacterized protein n=1 Tax=Prevotella micans F0438 TaxID=883158 RepID=H1Q0I3_9BACT|nr:hypothetical protein HMPREF9140_00421 [Prevotella micans F0438]